MERSPNAISWQSWVSDTSVGDRTHISRQTLLRYLSKANGKESPSEVLDSIFLDKLTPYQAARNLTDWMRTQKKPDGALRFKPLSVAFYRSLIPGFFESVLGTEHFDQRAFDRLVPKGKDIFVSTTKKAPTPDEFVHCLRIADPRERALLAVLCSGVRIGEAVSRKMKEIETRGEGSETYGRIRLSPEETKSRYMRYIFLTGECLQWIRDYRVGLDSEWIFPGNDGDHLSEVAAWKNLKELFDRAGLKDTDREIYSPHSMRTFADARMRKAGFKEKYTDATIGHKGKLGANASYLPWDEIEQEWKETCLPAMTWLSKPTELITAQKREIDDLKAEVENMKKEAAQRALQERNYLETLPPEIFKALTDWAAKQKQLPQKEPE